MGVEQRAQETCVITAKSESVRWMGGLKSCASHNGVWGLGFRVYIIYKVCTSICLFGVPNLTLLYN